MCNDWTGSVTAEQRAEITLNQMSDGAIILLHDFSGNTQSVDALDIIIPELLAQEYQFVTISQLFEVRGITPESHTKIYTRVTD
jgi:peptidoglycan/xylan/chitin deacetylase (PgdA/CDA1 family)